MKKMRIKIDRDGKTTIVVEGAAGNECLEFTKLVEQAVGAVEKRVLTEDCEKEPQINTVEDMLTEENGL